MVKKEGKEKMIGFLTMNLKVVKRMIKTLMNFNPLSRMKSKLCSIMTMMRKNLKKNLKI
jgi:hypothetical protein